MKNSRAVGKFTRDYESFLAHSRTHRLRCEKQEKKMFFRLRLMLNLLLLLVKNEEAAETQKITFHNFVSQSWEGFAMLLWCSCENSSLWERKNFIARQRGGEENDRRKLLINYQFRFSCSPHVDIPLPTFWKYEHTFVSADRAVGWWWWGKNWAQNETSEKHWCRVMSSQATRNNKSSRWKISDFLWNKLFINKQFSRLLNKTEKYWNTQQTRKASRQLEAQRFTTWL